MYIIFYNQLVFIKSFYEPSLNTTIEPNCVALFNILFAIELGEVVIIKKYLNADLLICAKLIALFYS